LSSRTAGTAVADKSDVALETDLVRLGLRASEHHPILKAVYAGPPEWLEEARRDPGRPQDLTDEARELARRAEHSGNDYVAGQSRSIATQLEVHQGRILAYDQMVAELLGVELQLPGPDEVDALRAEVLELAATLETASGEPVGAWESGRLISGEAKWDAAVETYAEGRRYAFGQRFPLSITENLELIRITEELWSVNLSWYPPSRMTFEVNVGTPRTPEATAFEVAHNIYPGDYLHLAVLQQHTYGRGGHVAASIKLKNAPESVISEGIEETAFLRLHPEPTPDQLLACKLEWLRRMATFGGAIALGVEGRAEVEVLETMAAAGFMDPARAEFQLRLIKHPLWGPYQYTYLLGRRLVEEGDRRARARGAEKAYLEYLYSGLHTPQSFLPGLDQLLAS
jgi:hypothetical protein